MIYIKLDSNMDLAITVNDTIYRGDKLNSKIIYLIPPMINDIAISSSRIYLNYIRADGVADVVELERKVAMYNDEYYQYTIPSSCYLSKCVGEVCTWIQIYSGSPSAPAISKSNKCILTVEKPKGIESNLCDHQLTSVYTLLKKYETLTELLEKLDATLKYDPDTNVLSVNCANEVLSEVTLPVTSDAVFKLIGDISTLPNFEEDESDESQESNKNLVDWLNTFYNKLDDTVFDIYDYLDYLDSDIPWNDISENTNARHTHDNKEILDKITGIYEGGGEGDSADIVTLGALLEATTSIVQTLTEKIPTTLPNPNSITIKVGETSTSYDGSEAVTIDIPTSSETEQDVSPTATVTKDGSVATITITDINGTTTATVEDGTDGHSPEVTASKTDGTTTISVDGTAVAEIKDGADGTTPAITASKADGVTTIKVDGTTIAEIKDGTDGHTPEITATKTDKTTTISVDGTAVAEIKDGENGTDGDDGYSPTATVSKSGTVTTVKITDKSGTTTAEVKDGEPGTDGTSVSISKISESTEDGGSNVVTFNDGKTLTVKNGNKGSDGATPTIELTETDSGVTISVENPYGTPYAATVKNGTDGKDGATPSFSIGTVETLAAGSDATASITGTDEKPVLNLGIPKGADGSGGGGGGVAKTTLASFTLEEDLTNYATLKVSLSDNPFKFSQILVSVTAQQADDSGQYQTYLYGADGSVSQVAHLNTKFSKSAVKSWFITASIFKSYVSAIASENVDGYMWTNSTQYSFVYTRKTESHTENYLRLSNMSAKAGMTVTVEGI